MLPRKRLTKNNVNGIRYESVSSEINGSLSKGCSRDLKSSFPTVTPSPHKLPISSKKITSVKLETLLLKVLSISSILEYQNMEKIYKA